MQETQRKKPRKAIKAQLHTSAGICVILTSSLPGGVELSQAYIDNRDRIEVERAFGLAKQRFGLDLITTRHDVTTRSLIALSILVMNVNHVAVVSFNLFLISII